MQRTHSAVGVFFFFFNLLALATEADLYALAMQGGLCSLLQDTGPIGVAATTPGPEQILAAMGLLFTTSVSRAPVT